MDSFENIDQSLKIFYKKIFPCDTLCKWLSCGSIQQSETLARREFSFSLAGDIYLRYQSFSDPASLRRELVKTCPHKIDIGAVYSAPPKLQRSMSSVSFVPEWKELVFDIDLTDYDDTRFCCGAGNPNAVTAICHHCWELAKCAVICLDRALREDFGFEHILWVYSGRRGVHCWVSDSVARRLDSAGRTAVAEYLTIIHGSDARKPKAKPPSLFEPSLHPSVEAAAELLSSHFLKYCISQDLLSSLYPNRVRWVLQHLPSDLASQRNKLLEQWTSNETNGGDSTAKRWNTLKCFLQEERRHNIIKDIVLSTVYPRLDINVTNGPGHLLKSPFCVHPKTGFVCVPIDPQKIEEFDPLTVPRLSELIAQLSLANAPEEVTSQHLLAYKQTTLRPYIEFFESFVNRLSASMEETAKMKSGIDNLEVHGEVSTLMDVSQK
ncbi:DNA primase small subunit [Taenia crassiceps]|uniref:DNA primase n=1 Tax=Taenia crassiceps TaxID=6207 RepID=A0ABR4QN54_9CEST